MNTKIKMLIGRINRFIIDILIPLCLSCGIFLSFCYLVQRRQRTINEGISGGRLIKVGGYVFEKLTIDGHEYLKFNDGIAHSGSCPCFRKMEAEKK